LQDSVVKITSDCGAALPEGSIVNWSQLQFGTNVTVKVPAEEVCRKLSGK